MSDFQTLLVDTLKNLPEVRAFISRIEQMEAELEKAKQPNKMGPKILAIDRKELVRQIGGPLVRRGEAAGILRPIVSNGGKGPKKRYPADQVEALLKTFSLPNGASPQKNGKV